MPTGYTIAIERGCTFEEYVWRCVRGMDVCIVMRDAPLDEPVPETFEPSGYHRKRLEERVKELAAIDALTDAQVMDRQAEDNAAVRARNEKRRAEHEEIRRKYTLIRDQVVAWAPPTPDHDGLKRYMLEQIDLSFDRGGPWLEKERDVVTPAEWRRGEFVRFAEEISYARDEWDKEQDRTAWRNLWLKQLRESVPQPIKGIPEGGGP